MKKITIALLTIVILASLIYGVFVSVTSFVGQDNPFNISFDGVNSESYELALPKSGYMNNVTLTLTGIEHETNRYCHQETANISTECGGLSSGAYGYANVSSTGYVYMNYSIPISVNRSNVLWEIHLGGTANTSFNYNHTLPTNCTQNASLQLMIHSNRSGVTNDAGIYCYTNYSNWQRLNRTGFSTGSTVIDYGIQYISRAYDGIVNTGVVFNYLGDPIGWASCTMSGGTMHGCIGEESIYWDIDFPINVTIYIGSVDSNPEYNFSGILNRGINVSLNITKYNEILRQRCVCDGCRILDYDCIINHTFKSNTISTLEVEVYNISLEYGLKNCTQITETPTNGTALNYSFINIDGDTAVGVNLSTRIDYSIDDSKSYNYSHSSINPTSYQYCIYPSWANLSTDITTQYAFGSNIFNYFTSNTTLTNTTKNINFYISIGTKVTATVYDNINNKVEGAYIHVQEFDFDDGTYKEVGQAVTNFEGEANLYLTLNSVYYRFLIYHPIDILREITTPTYIYDTVIEFHIDLYDEVLEDYDTVMGVDYTLDFNEVTNNFRYIFSDTSATISGGILKVWQTTARQNILIDTTTSLGTSGTILIGVSPQNGTTFLAKAYVIIDGEEYYVDSASHSYMEDTITNHMGLLIVFVLTIVFGFIFVFSIPLGIIALPIPTVLAAAIKLINIDVYLAIGIWIAAVVLAIFINDRK
jgi:hypothetical protein